MKSLKEFRARVDSIVSTEYKPGLFTYSLSAINKMWRAYREGKSFDDLIHTSLSHIETLTNFPLYWFVNGISDIDLCKLYASDEYRFCKNCNSVFRKSEGFKTCCKQTCYTEHRENGYVKLSASRRLYNSRNPVQYAERHKINIEEAIKTIHTINTESSVRCIEYWMKQGMDEVESRQKVSELQSIVSPRTIDYWLHRGYDKESAIKMVSKFQSQSTINMHKKARENGSQIPSPFCTDYWMENFDVTYDKACSIVSKRAKSASDALYSKYTKEELRQFNKMCRESWASDKEYEEYRNSIITGTNASKEASTFFDNVSADLNYTSVYYGIREYGKYIPGYQYVRYDYVNLDTMCVVEYNGVYWHNTQESREHDNIKKNFIESLGFRYMSVNDIDVKSDRNRYIVLVQNFIRGNNEN